MPGCSLEREVVGSTAFYRISGRFEGACAWDLSKRLEKEPLGELVLDFSQVSDFVDYGIAVMANALLALRHKTVHLMGVRQHQLRLFKYFGVDPDQLLHPEEVHPDAEEPVVASEVA